MFRVRASEIQTQIPKAARIILGLPVPAFALSFAAVLRVYGEYRLLGDWEASSGRVSPAAIGSLRRDIGTRIVVRSTASAVLLLCTLAMLRLQQPPGPLALDGAVQETEKAAILAALAQCDNHRERSAQILGISVRTLRDKMNRYSLQ